MDRNQAVNMVLNELDRARGLYPRWPQDEIHQVAIIAEEAGELVQAALQKRYEPHKGGNPIKEAVQTAAMAIRFLEEQP